MRVAICVLLFSVFCHPAASQVSGRAPRIATDSFIVFRNGVPDGAQVLALTRTSSGYRFSDRLNVGNDLTRQATVDFDIWFRPIRSVSQSKSEDQSSRSAITFRGGRARGYVFPLDGVPGKRVPVDTALPPGTTESLAMLPVILNRRWRVGLSDTLTVFVADDLSISRYILRVIAVEDVSVPAGRFRALRGEVVTTQDSIALWVTNARPHGLLKMAWTNFEVVRAR